MQVACDRGKKVKPGTVVFIGLDYNGTLTFIY